MKGLLFTLVFILLVIACAPIENLPEQEEQDGLSVGGVEQDENPVLEEQVISKPKEGLILEGNFIKRIMKAEGKVTITRLSDQTYQMEFTNFDSKISDESKLVLSKLRSVYTTTDLVEPFEIGKLQSPVGRQFYYIPETVAVEEYQSLTIITLKNDIILASAPLILLID